MADSRRLRLATAKNAVIRVGDGRGFVVEGQLVVTAAHCLPHLPPAIPASYTTERTYGNLLGPLGLDPTIWTECVFVDPMADIAVLAGPDNQVLSDEADAYDELIEARPPLRIAASVMSTNGWRLSLDGRWEEVRLKMAGNGRAVTLSGASLLGGMSGSPVLNADGHAVAVVSSSPDERDGDRPEYNWQPSLMSSLPGWLLASLFKPLADLPRRLTAPTRARRRHMRAFLKQRGVK